MKHFAIIGKGREDLTALELQGILEDSESETEWTVIETRVPYKLINDVADELRSIIKDIEGDTYTADRLTQLIKDLYQ